jgi:DNA replication protein DnaC
MNKISDLVNFESSSLEKKSLFDQYKKRPIDKFPALATVFLLEFATLWDWDHSKYTKRGSRGAKPYVVNVHPCYQPDLNSSEAWEKYCYAKMVLHHPFSNNPDELLGDHIDWAAAYQTDCVDKRVSVCVPPLHLHIDTLPEGVYDKEDDESDSESIENDEEHEADNYRAEWMQEAGRCPNQQVEVDFGNLGNHDLDLAYDWNANSPNQTEINAASKWLMDRIRESPNDIAQDLPNVDYRFLKGKQREVFLQVMAYFKKIKAGGADQPPLLQLNVDGTAGTGKSFLIWTITHALKELFYDELAGHDPVVRLAPTGIAAFGIRGWTINYGLVIPVKEGKEFNQLGQNGLTRLQARWKKAKLLILDEKSMVGRAQMGRCDRRLRQAFPQNAEEILGGIPSIIFGDFAQLPPIGDTPLYSTKESRKRAALHEEGRRVFESFSQSVTLDKVYRQAGEDAEQVKFRDALMRLRTYSTTQEDYDLLSTRTWDKLTPQERTEFDKVLHLLPTRATVEEVNFRHLAALGKPVLRCKAKHNHSEAKKASDDDADGLEKEILLAEGAKVMLTRNLWTAKGNLNIYNLMLKNV